MSECAFGFSSDIVCHSWLLFSNGSVSWLLSMQPEKASAKGIDRPFDSSVKGLVWWAMGKDLD